MAFNFREFSKFIEFRKFNNFSFFMICPISRARTNFTAVPSDLCVDQIVAVSDQALAVVRDANTPSTAVKPDAPKRKRPHRFWRIRFAFRSSTAGSGPISRSVGQPLALSALDHLHGPLFVAHAETDPVVIPEVKFRQIPVQMLFLAVLVGATHAALED